jgi:hypothetical protein
LRQGLEVQVAVRLGVSDRVTEVVEQVEYTLGEGPSLAAYASKAPVFDALTDDQVGDALVVAQVASRTLLEWQADAPTGTVAWQLEPVPSHQMEVHQATGRISVQTRISVADALVLLRAYAFSHDRPVTDVAADVASGLLRFD